MGLNKELRQLELKPKLLLRVLSFVGSFVEDVVPREFDKLVFVSHSERVPTRGHIDEEGFGNTSF